MEGRAKNARGDVSAFPAPRDLARNDFPHVVPPHANEPPRERRVSARTGLPAGPPSLALGAP